MTGLSAVARGFMISMHKGMQFCVILRVPFTVIIGSFVGAAGSIEI